MCTIYLGGFVVSCLSSASVTWWRTLRRSFQEDYQSPSSKLDCSPHLLARVQPHDLADPRERPIHHCVRVHVRVPGRTRERKWVARSLILDLFTYLQVDTSYKKQWNNLPILNLSFIINAWNLLCCIAWWCRHPSVVVRVTGSSWLQGTRWTRLLVTILLDPTHNSVFCLAKFKSHFNIKSPIISQEWTFVSTLGAHDTSPSYLCKFRHIGIVSISSS